jgi:hypothetical protein
LQIIFLSCVMKKYWFIHSFLQKILRKCSRLVNHRLEKHSQDQRKKGCASFFLVSPCQRTLRYSSLPFGHRQSPPSPSSGRLRRRLLSRLSRSPRTNIHLRPAATTLPTLLDVRAIKEIIAARPRARRRRVEMAPSLGGGGGGDDDGAAKGTTTTDFWMGSARHTHHPNQASLLYPAATAAATAADVDDFGFRHLLPLIGCHEKSETFLTLAGKEKRKVKSFCSSMVEAAAAAVVRLLQRSDDVDRNSVFVTHLLRRRCRRQLT